MSGSNLTIRVDGEWRTHGEARNGQKSYAQTPRRRADAELLDVAAEVFIAEGFAAASTNKITKLANASKTTFYSRFPTKEDLFLAVIDRRMNAMFGVVAKFPVSEDFHQTLRQFGANLVQMVTSPGQMALVRMISMEAHRYPQIASRFYTEGPKRGEDALARYLSIYVQNKRLRDESPALMAQHLMSLLTGGPVRWQVLGFDQNLLTPRAVKMHIDDALVAFYRAYETDALG